MKITILFDEFKKNKSITNLLLTLIFLYPISVVIGPALIELTIFCSLIGFFFLYKIESIREFYLKFQPKEILIFYIIIIVSSLMSDNILTSLKSSFFSIRFFLFSIIVYFLIKKIKIFNNLFFLICAIFFFICLFDGYLQFLTGKNIFLYTTSSDYVTSFFFDEKKLGRFLITFSPILVGLYLFLGNQSKNFKLISSFVFLNIVFFIVLFTSERVSMFYSSFTIFITILYGFKFSKKFLLLLIFPCLLFFTSYGLNINNFNLTVKDTVDQITDNNNSFSYPSKQHRAFMQTSYKLFKENPIIGIGPNNYRNKCKDIIMNDVVNCSTHPHNIFFQILVETGLVGFLIYIYFVLKIFKKIIGFMFKKNDLDKSIFFLLPIIYFLNPFFPSGNFFNNWFMAIGTFSTPFYLHFNELKNNKE